MVGLASSSNTDFSMTCPEVLMATIGCVVSVLSDTAQSILPVRAFPLSFLSRTKCKGTNCFNLSGAPDEGLGGRSGGGAGAPPLLFRS